MERVLTLKWMWLHQLSFDKSPQMGESSCESMRQKKSPEWQCFPRGKQTLWRVTHTHSNKHLCMLIIHTRLTASTLHSFLSSSSYQVTNHYLERLRNRTTKKETLLMFIYPKNLIVLKETHHAFSFFPAFCVLSMFLFMWKMLKVKKVKVCTNRSSSHPQKTLLLNMSSEVPPLIPWLCDFTLRHHVTHLYKQGLDGSLACNNLLSLGLLFIVLLCQACVCWPIRVLKHLNLSDCSDTI